MLHDRIATNKIWFFLQQEGYQYVHEITRSKQSVIVRAFCSKQQQHVIIKYHSEELPSDRSIQKLYDQ
jgi:hypothetical protein